MGAGIFSGDLQGVIPRGLSELPITKLKLGLQNTAAYNYFMVDIYFLQMFRPSPVE